MRFRLFADVDRRYFDFADMILETINQIERQETLRADLNERFQYIMIDEFQDTNDAQFRLAYLIANHSSQEGKPNIMVVGDDDQAIYRFQGAELSNVQNFMDSFTGTQTIVLSDNYRSHQKILDAIARVSDKIEHRLVDDLPDFSKKLLAKANVGQGRVEHFLYPTQAHELTEVTKKIKALFSTSKQTIAVLAREHKSLEKLARMLLDAGVPVRYERSNNILENEAALLVTNMLLMLQAIMEGNRELVNSLLAQLLAHQMWGLDPQELWQFAAANRSANADWLLAFSRHTKKPFRSLGEWLLELSELASHQPLTVVIEHLIGLRQTPKYQSPFRAYYLSSDQLNDEYIRTLSALRQLRRLADSFAVSREATLESFNAFVRLSQSHRVKIADESVFATADQAVQLMTVHKAKGLEFDTVFVIDLIDASWRPRRARRKPPSNLESLQDYGEDADDYARLLYVALSRARRNIIATSYSQNEEGREVLPTPLLLELKPTEVSTSSLPVEVLEQNLRWPELNQREARQTLATVLESYELPVTSLLNFLDITTGGPQHFLERNLLRLPDLKRPAQAYGTAIHEALATAQRLKNSGKLRLSPVIKEFERTLGDAHLESRETERYAVQGRELLTRLFAWPAFQLPRGSEPERVIEHVRLDNAVIRGNLDRLDISPSELHIVDYKTGTPLRGLLTSTTKTEGVKAWRHRTQLIFYALLLAEQGRAKPTQTVTASMVYLAAEEESRLTKSYVPTVEDLDYLKSLIEAVWRHVQQVNMPDITRYPQDLAGIRQFESDLIEGKA